jgi:putative transposase
MARVVCPQFPHHITQRGVRRFDVFLDDDDRLRYMELLKKYSSLFGLSILAYCLMSNHIHVVGVPSQPDSIYKTFRDCHGTFAAEFNKKLGKTGQVWQARPYSCVLDENHTWAAIRYVERNPVRAGMVRRAEDYSWSSASAHCGLTTDKLVAPWPGTSDVSDWSSWLANPQNNDDAEKQVRARTYTGRPCGPQDFVKQIEIVTGRSLTPGKPGPKCRVTATD